MTIAEEPLKQKLQFKKSDTSWGEILDDVSNLFFGEKVYEKAHPFADKYAFSAHFQVYIIMIYKCALLW